MRTRLAALLILVALPALPATAPVGCGSLCGPWQLDATHSDAVAESLDATLAQYKDPRPKRMAVPGNGDTVREVIADMERSLGPIHDRLGRADLREELLTLMTPPPQLQLEARGTDLVIRSGKNSQRTLSPGEPHSRVDAGGTARIQCRWDKGRFIISERYDRKREYSETYAVQRADGSLLVTREVERPGMKTLRLHAIYRRT